MSEVLNGKEEKVIGVLEEWAKKMEEKDDKEGSAKDVEQLLSSLFSTVGADHPFSNPEAAKEIAGAVITMSSKIKNLGLDNVGLEDE